MVEERAKWFTSSFLTFWDLSYNAIFKIFKKLFTFLC